MGKNYIEKTIGTKPSASPPHGINIAKRILQDTNAFVSEYTKPGMYNSMRKFVSGDSIKSDMRELQNRMNRNTVTLSSRLDIQHYKKYTKEERKYIEEQILSDDDNHRSLYIHESCIIKQGGVLLGRGGFGNVYKAKLKTEGKSKDVAVKCFGEGQLQNHSSGGRRKNVWKHVCICASSCKTF